MASTTGRLTLIPATARHIRTELESPQELPALLGATVAPSWPPGEYDGDAMAHFLERLETLGEKGAGWYVWYAVRTDVTPAALVGSGGYMGPPDGEGTVEVGYSVLPEFRGQGFAGEIVEALVARAFSFPQVSRVIAHTVASNAASVAVLMKCGFSLAEATGGESVRYERRRVA